jgi:Protein of unknown function (DUF2848)
MHAHLSFDCGSGPILEPRLRELVFVGFGGRHQPEVDAHVAELSRAGIKAPRHTPCLYPVAPHLLTQATRMTVFGHETMPEVEFALFTWQGRDYVTVGNDQGDVEIERLVSAEKAKNLCPKVVANTAWALTDCLDVWDRLRLRLTCNGIVMQEGGVDLLMRPEALLAFVASATKRSGDGRMIFSGTIASRAAYPAGPHDIEICLEDPMRGRAIRHSFRIEMLEPFWP